MIETFIVMPFTLRARCPKCDGDRFAWRYRTHVREDLAGHDVTPVDPPRYPHLRLTCERCGYGFNMETKDAAK